MSNAPTVRLFQSSLPAAFHRTLTDQLAPFGDIELGHDLPTLAPLVMAVLQDAAVLGEVARMLGPGARPDGCMHVHHNRHPEASDWHQDNYCGGPWPEPMAILCYFPQDTPPEMGPTEARLGGRQVLAAGPAGTCLLMRHDTEHRATANRTGRQRYMLKFLYRPKALP